MKGKTTPLILCITAAIGVVATAIATVKAKEKIEEEIEKAEEVNGELKPQDKIVIGVKYGAAPAIIGLGTVFCIFGSNYLNKKQQATLAAAYPLLQKSYDEYKDKVKEVLGIDAHNKVVDSIKKENCNPPELLAPCMFYESTLNVDKMFEPEIERTFYDELTGRYFESTLFDVVQAEYHLNRNYCMGKYVSAAEWSEFLGMERRPEDENRYWYPNYEDGEYWIDFNHELAVLDDGMEVIFIKCLYDPIHTLEKILGEDEEAA